MEKSIAFLFLCPFYAGFRAVRSDILFIHDYFYKYVLNTMFFWLVIIQKIAMVIICICLVVM